MFRIDRDANAIQPLKARSLSELGFRERAHLQEWVAKYPSCLGEDLLIIQKEFAGFSDTQERLDLLALDKEGRLVIIENKLDDTGRDVTWHALKYASYCAGLKTENICAIYQEHLQKAGQDRNAAELIADFLEVGDLAEVALNRGLTQRIMLIAANFRKEVTSTVLWLMSFKLQVQCFKVTPWAMGEEIFLNVEQIIPVKDTQDFVIGLADKAQEEVQASSAEIARHGTRREFWTELLRVMQTRSTLFGNVSPGKDSGINAGSGLSGIYFSFVATGRYARPALRIHRASVDETRLVFERLLARREIVETDFGGPLVWESLEGRQRCEIRTETDANIFDRDEWPQMIEFMIDAMIRLEKAFREPLWQIGIELKAKASFSEISEDTVAAED